MELFLWALAIGVVIGLIGVFIMKSKLKSVGFQRAASNYMVEGTLNLTTRTDVFLYKETDKTAKPQNNNN